MSDHTGRIIDLSHALHRFLFNHGKPPSMPKGLAMIHVFVLSFIGSKKDATMGDIAKVLSVRPSSATSFINRLVRLGLVSRKHDQHNRKLVRLSMLPKGKTLLNQAMKAQKVQINSALEIVPQNDLKTLADAMERVIAHLYKI